MKQSRWKSKLVWTAVAAQLLVILIATNLITPTEVETINVIITAGLQTLTLVGVLNDPTNKEKF